jgi:Gas vesicle protein G
MGLFTAIATLPLAPVRGVAWVAQQVAEEAERQLDSGDRIRQELLQAELDVEAGLIDAEEHDRRAGLLLVELAATRRAAEARGEWPRAREEENNG